MKKKAIGIVHYNTPELTEACILSIRKHGCDWPVTILDNSDARPFLVTLPGVTVIDNTKGQIIDFDAELAKYPERSTLKARVSNYGSVKHMMSTQYLWSVLKDGFILLDSDILVKADITFLWDESYAAVGSVQYLKRIGRKEHDRLNPVCLYMNVPLLVKNGARFYDPERSWWLQPGENNPANWYDTGACLLEDIRNTKPALVALVYGDLSKRYTHFGSASWRKTDLWEQTRWLERNRALWTDDPGYQLGVVPGPKPKSKPRAVKQRKKKTQNG